MMKIYEVYTEENLQTGAPSTWLVVAKNQEDAIKIVIDEYGEVGDLVVEDEFNTTTPGSFYFREW
jgi:hypothetical protein